MMSATTCDGYHHRPGKDDMHSDYASYHSITLNGFASCIVMAVTDPVNYQRKSELHKTSQIRHLTQRSDL